MSPHLAGPTLRGAAPGSMPLAVPKIALRTGDIVRHSQDEDFTVYAPAGLVLRWYALTLDVVFCAPLDVLVHLPFTRYLERLDAYGHDTKGAVLAALLTAIPLLLYFIAPTALWGQTLGKRIVGVRVIGSNFSPQVAVGAVIFRETFGKLVSLLTFGLGFLLAGWTRRGRALHDYLSGTQVISYRLR